MIWYMVAFAAGALIHRWYRTSTSMHVCTTYATVPTDYLGHTYCLTLPYRYKLRFHQVSYYTVKGMDRKPLRHISGIPLLVTPNDLHVDAIEMEYLDPDTDEMCIHTVHGNELPSLPFEKK